MNTTLKASIVASIIVVLAVAAWFHWKPTPTPVGQVVVAPESKEMTGVPDETIHPPKVIVKAPEAKKKQGLPASVVNDPAQHVITGVSLKISDHPQEVTPVINETTGKTEIYVTEKPLPWLAAENKREVRVDYIIKHKDATAKVMSLSYTQDLVAIKALDFGVRASVDADGELRAGVGVGWQF
jgi:hypothetical protein